MTQDQINRRAYDIGTSGQPWDPTLGQEAYEKFKQGQDWRKIHIGEDPTPKIESPPVGNLLYKTATGDVVDTSPLLILGLIFSASFMLWLLLHLFGGFSTDKLYLISLGVAIVSFVMMVFFMIDTNIKVRRDEREARGPIEPKPRRIVKPHNPKTRRLSLIVMVFCAPVALYNFATYVPGTGNPIFGSITIGTAMFSIIAAILLILGFVRQFRRWIFLRQTKQK